MKSYWDIELHFSKYQINFSAVSTNLFSYPSLLPMAILQDTASLLKEKRPDRASCKLF